jgi:integrase
VPTYSKIHHVLSNPFYASVYAAVTALRRYAARRDQDPASFGLRAFFVFDHGVAVSALKIHYAFRILRRQFRRRPCGWHPLHRMHDLRHTFVCRRLQLWYQEGVDFDRQLLALSTYIGHVGPSETYWYVTATPQLMAIAARRLAPLPLGGAS